jgi:ABC-type glycerol-3-phosphate transport system substrate-binding protein
MKALGLLLSALALATTVGAAPAAAASDYKVICTQAWSDGRPLGPEVCVPVPIDI